MKKYLRGLFVMLSVLFLLMSTAFAASDYTITDIRLTDLKGNAIDYDGGSCMVNVTVTKNTNVADGYVVISTYTEDETLIGFNYLFTSLEEGKSATLGAMVSLPDTEKIGKVKAMVWDSLDGMTPLAASKTLVPGEEVEPEPTPTPIPEPTSVQVDATLINNNTYDWNNIPEPYNGVSIINEYTMDPDGTPSTGDEYTITDAVLRIKNSATSSASRATEYRLNNASLYVNGEIFCNVNSSNVDVVHSMLKKSTGITTLVQDEDIEGVYNKIYMDYYVVASLSQITTTTIDTQLRFTGITAMPNDFAVLPGSSLVIYNDDIRDGCVTVNVTRNGEKCDIADLQQDDIVALKYNIKCTFDNFGIGFDKIDIIATSNTVTGKYNAYDPDLDVYDIGGVEYNAVKSQSLTLGSTYKFRLDPFGRLFDNEEQAAPKNYAIVERYVDIISNPQYNSEYDYVDVVTLDGQSKRLYIDDNARYAIRTVMADAGINTSFTNNANISFQNRIIEYKVKASTGRVKELVMYRDSYNFACSRYNKADNRLDRALATDAKVLDASKYNTNSPSASDYLASSLANLSEYVDYDGILVGKNSNNQWAYVIITATGATYNAGSNFAVVAKNASANNKAIVDDEEVYQLKVMQNGESTATNLNIALYAQVYVNGLSSSYSYAVTNLKEGAVFYYTTDSYGLVDRIDVVLEGGYDYDVIKSLITEEYGSVNPTIWNVIMLPDSSAISEMTWFVDVDEKDGIALNEHIQLFIAPVVTATTNAIAFGTVEGNETDGLYVNTNVDYTFSIADDANIYEYALGDAGMGANAFCGGAFRGFDIADASADGKAWMTNVPASECNFDGLVQFAFVMAVDGEITNALLFNA